SIAIRQIPTPQWKRIAEETAGQIDSVIELLSGKLSSGVMQILSRKGTGLFPSPKEISLECSCPDGAYMCKHLAAVRYGVGARLDHSPELLFVLRKDDQMDLISQASQGQLGRTTQPPEKQVLASTNLSELFGIELEPEAPKTPSQPKRATRPRATSPA